jgi:dynein light chain roadblock-type
MAGQTSEVEETLKRLQGHKGVIGVVIVNQDGIPIRTTFDQAVTVQYAGLITQLCSKARSAVRELDPQVTSHAPVLAPEQTPVAALLRV